MPTSFSDQVQRLIDCHHHDAFGIDADAFRSQLEPLRDALTATESVGDVVDVENGSLAFAIVVSSARFPIGQMLTHVPWKSGAPVERLFPKTPNDFHPIPSLNLPNGDAYILVGVNRGDEFRNAAPNDAATSMGKAHRSPLTIEEGISLITLYPRFLKPNHCFSLLGSRCGDKRVPALWLSEKRPKLGWCWAGNPHTWLGAASCARRVGGVFIDAPV